MGYSDTDGKTQYDNIVHRGAFETAQSKDNKQKHRLGVAVLGVGCGGEWVLRMGVCVCVCVCGVCVCVCVCWSLWFRFVCQCGRCYDCVGPVVCICLPCILLCFSRWRAGAVSLLTCDRSPRLTRLQSCALRRCGALLLRALHSLGG